MNAKLDMLANLSILHTVHVSRCTVNLTLLQFHGTLFYILVIIQEIQKSQFYIMVEYVNQE
jgi:hypothetical protein